MVVPKTAHPPVLDGRLSPGEWSRAAACTAFVKAFDGGLAKLQTTAWVTYDDHYLYVAFQNYRGEQLSFLSAKGRRTDDEAIVMDPSNEVWISPPTSPATTYQTLLNVYPAVLDVKMIPSLGYSSKAWSGKWEVASSQSAGSWTIEARAPLPAFGVEHIADGATWRALFAADIMADGDKFRAWAPGGPFADIARHGFVHFSADGPAIQFLDMETLFGGRPALSMAAVGAEHTRSPITVTARFGGLAPGPADIVVTRTVSPAPGAAEPFVLNADLGAAPSGFCEIRAQSGQTLLYHQVFPYTVNGFVRRPPARTQASPYQQAFGLEASYAPLSKKVLVKIDRYYMPQRAAVASGRVQLLDPATKKVVAERPIAPFREDYSEFPVDVKDLRVPVEGQNEWRAGGTAPVEYQLHAVLAGKDGQPIGSASLPVKLLGYQFPWMPNEIGISDRVIPPWTPIQRSGPMVSLWNKQYVLNGAGVAEKIVNSRAPQLAGPMKLEAVVDGRRVDFAGQSLTAGKQTDAAVEFTGTAQGGPLRLEVATRVEFDGFVWNTMTIEPTRANVSRLSLLVDLPEQEAPYFVTTSGGWSSYYGATPERWDSRESSLTSMVGNFVPYIFFTDSERGFCWFADNEKGWRLDPARPTQEVLHHDGLVTLRVNFIDLPGAIERPITVHYGWMVTPQKPQPHNWRGYLIGYQKYFPQATPIFWNEADWAVSWPYYSSPFPKDYEKSRRLLAGSAAKGVVGCVGNIAHAIARYVDYQGRPFPAMATEWGITPGDASDGNVVRSRGPNDFQLFHFDRWSKLSGLSCLYFDENYLAEDRNYLNGGAYLLPDERVQPGYDYLGLREYNKRLRQMFFDNGKPAPNLWEHITGGQAVYAWMPDVSMEGENVEPAELEHDYIEALPASRLRSIGMGRNLGTAPFIMDQADRHPHGEASKVLAHQLVGWTLAHDVLPEGVSSWPVLASELELWQDDTRFLPYWKKGLGIDCPTPGFDVSAHVRPGRAVLWVVNENRQDGQAQVRLDLAKLGLDPARELQAYDAENGQHYPVVGGVVTVPVPKRMWRAVRLFQPQRLAGNVTFVADFDHEAGAVEAYGGRYPLGKALPELVPSGRTGWGLSIDRPVEFLARQHVRVNNGSISVAFRTPGYGTGTLLSVGSLELRLSNRKIDLIAPNGAVSPLSASAVEGWGWNQLRLSWQGREVQVAANGTPIFRATLLEPLQLTGWGRGADIRDTGRNSEPSKVTLGPIPGGVIDDLIMASKP